THFPLRNEPLLWSSRRSSTPPGAPPSHAWLRTRRAEATAESTFGWWKTITSPRPAPLPIGSPPFRPRHTGPRLSLSTTSTTRWRKPPTSRPPRANASGTWPRITADGLVRVREPLRWCLGLGERTAPDQVAAWLRHAARGPADDEWV